MLIPTTAASPQIAMNARVMVGRTDIGLLLSDGPTPSSASTHIQEEGVIVAMSKRCSKSSLDSYVPETAPNRPNRGSAEFGEIHRVRPGMAGAAEHGVIDHDRSRRLIAFEHFEDERARVDVVLADAAAAEAASRDSSSSTVPAIHRGARYSRWKATRWGE